MAAGSARDAARSLLAAFPKAEQQQQGSTDLIDGVGSAGSQSGSQRGEQETSQVKRDRGHGKPSGRRAHNQSCNTRAQVRESARNHLLYTYH